MLTHRESGSKYVGKDNRLGRRSKKHLALKTPDCPAIHNAIKKHGGNAFDVELIPYPNISEKALYEVEKWKIRQLQSHRSQGGYNLTWGGDGVDSETNRENNLKRVKDGTHHFLDGEKARENALKRVENGTNPFLGGEIQRETQLKRVKDGTHHFLGSDIGSEINHKRIEKGTHNFFRKNNPNARPEYYQAYWEFILMYPLGIKEARKHFHEKFSYIPRWTRNRWIKKWQAELEEPTTEKS